MGPAGGGQRALLPGALALLQISAQIPNELQLRHGDDDCLLDRSPNSSPMRRVPLMNLKQGWWWETRGDLPGEVGQERAWTDKSCCDRRVSHCQSWDPSPSMQCMRRTISHGVGTAACCAWQVAGPEDQL